MGRLHSPESPSRRGLLGREPGFRRLFLATLGSGAGTWLALVALEVDVYDRTHSSTWIAALLIADLLPTFAIGVFAGPLIDRLSRRALMIGSDLVRFCAFAALTFTTSATQIVVLAAVVGIATGFFRPAVYAAIPNLVEDEDLPGANSLLQTVDNITWAAGSVLGGALAATAGVDAAYWINAFTFLLSALLLVGIPQRMFQEAAAASHGHWQDLKEGFALTVSSPGLLTVLVAWNIAMVANAAVNVSEPNLALVTFSGGSFGLGLMMGSAGLGLAAGAYLAGSWIETRGLANVYGAALALMAVGIGVAAAAPERLGRVGLRRDLGLRQRGGGRLQRAARPARRAGRAARARVRGADELERRGAADRDDRRREAHGRRRRALGLGSGGGGSPLRLLRRDSRSPAGSGRAHLRRPRRSRRRLQPAPSPRNARSK